MSFNQNQEEIKEQIFKIITLGCSGVGKTSLLTRLSQDQFRDNQVATITIDFAYKRLFIKNQPIKLQMWDTAGWERFRSTVAKYYFKGAHGIFLVFDLTNEASFSEIQMWYKQTQEDIQSLNQEASFLLVGCKCDLESNRKISYDVAYSIASSLGMHYIETSSKMNINCLEAADYLGKLCLSKINETKNQNPPGQKIKQEVIKQTSSC